MSQKLSKSNQTPRKPGWNLAPAWAKFLTLDFDGEWCWHEMEPWVVEWMSGWSSNGNQTHAATESDPDVVSQWRTSLDIRTVID